MGKLIVIEGTDASGKLTQTKRLSAWLQNRGVTHRCLDFPCYESRSSALVRMYLDGQFGGNPAEVNAYAASTFYAVDRYASYQADWRGFYRGGGLLLCNRYTTSNAVHQSGKEPQEKQDAFLGWLYDFEYNKLGIPRPDLVLFLDMPPVFSRQLLEARKARTDQQDIHENDKAYLESCYHIAKKAAAQGGWVTIPCTENGAILTEEAIHAAIKKEVENYL